MNKHKIFHNSFIFRLQPNNSQNNELETY